MELQVSSLNCYNGSCGRGGDSPYPDPENIPMRFYELETVPAVEPVSVAEVKDHLYIPSASTIHDSKLAMFIKAARQIAEEFTSRVFITQTWRLWLDDWNPETYLGGQRIGLQKPKLIEVTKLSSYDEDDTETVLDYTDYFVPVEASPSYLQIKDNAALPTDTRSAKRFKIEFTAGDGLAADVLDAIKMGIIMIAGHLFQRADDANNTGNALKDSGAKAFLQPYRILSI